MKIKVPILVVSLLFLIVLSMNVTGAELVGSSGDYGFTNGVMTDDNGLTYETNINGVVTINNERYVAFALKGTYAGTEYTYTSMDYDWTWTHTVNGTDHVFEAINNNDNFVWKQYWYFYEDKPMKIEHYLKNNYPQAISDMEMYYIITVEDTDEIRYNGTSYNVDTILSDGNVHLTGNFTSNYPQINFQQYFFDFSDLVTEDFDINEFYLGSGSVIGYPAIDIVAIGFTKGNGILNVGQEVWIDPTFEYGRWIYNSSVVAGLVDVGWYSAPNVFNDAGTWKLIAGEGDGVFNGYYWSGTAWVGDSGIVSGLGDVGSKSTPTIFNDSGTWKLISGNEAGTFLGYQWNTSTSQWDSNSSIVTGLGDIGSRSTPTVFNDAGTWKLITGNVGGTFSGYQWNISTSQWDSNSSIKAGLPDVGFHSTPTVFYDSGTWCLISGEQDRVWNGYYWSGSAWISDSSIVTGIGSGGYHHYTCVFYDSGTWKYIGGWEAGGFYGFQWQPDETTPTYSNNDTSDTTAGASCTFSIDYNDNLKLHSGGQYIFATNNTGSWVNESAVNFTTTPESISTIKTLNSTIGLTIGYRWYADDNAGNVNNTSIYTFVTVVDIVPPTYTGAATNNSFIGEECNFSITIDDNIALHPNGQWIFSTNNSGVWVNDTPVNFTSTSENIGTVKTLSTVFPNVIGYRWYVSDNFSNIGSSPIYTLTTIVWQSDSSIVAGLVDVGQGSTPTVFNDSGTWKLISGEYDGVFNGYYWSGTAWVGDGSIVAGLGDVGDRSKPTVFNDGGTWKLIAGEYDGVFNGFQWNTSTSQWDSNSSIVTGLGDIGQRSAPTVFNDAGTWKLITGNVGGTFSGYYWSGTAWVGDSGIVSGLGDVGSKSTPTIFYDAGTWKLIAGEDAGVFNGYYWSGSAWVGDSGIISGLGGIGINSAPEVFNDSGTWKLIAGEWDGVFNGYITKYIPTPPPIITLISVTPDPINTNYTGEIKISYIVASSDPLNLSSLAFLYGLNYTIPAGGDMHNYISGPQNSIAHDGIYRAPHRNLTPYLSWEFNTAITNNNVWQWGGYDNDSVEITKEVINATHTWINVTGVTQYILPSSFYISKAYMYNAPKTGFEVSRVQGLIFKMWNVEKTRNRDDNYFANFYFDSSWESTIPTYPIEIGYCNNSYNPATDDIDISPFCTKFVEWDGNRWINHSWNPGANASYTLPLTVNASHYTSPSPDDVNYIWLRSNTISSKSFVLNATNHDPGICNRSFAQTETFWTYNELNGVTTAQAYTPSFFTTFARNDEELLHHLYIADTTGKWGHSEIFNESIGISSVPVPSISFEHFSLVLDGVPVSDTDMDATYDDGNLSLNIHCPADPDGGIVSYNVTLHYANNQTFLAVVNDTFTTSGDEYVDLSFSTTPHYSASNYYTLKCVSTDDEGSVATKWLLSNFTLDADGNQGWISNGRVDFWGFNDIPSLYTTISDPSLMSYSAGVYTMHIPFFKSKYNDTFNFNETVHLKSLNNEDVSYFRFMGDTVFDNANIHAWNTTSDTPAPITDTHRGYVYSSIITNGDIDNSNFSYLGSDFYRQEGLNFVGTTTAYTINNTVFSHNAEGLIMEECANFTISNCTINDNVNVGVGVYFSNSTIVANNTITSNGGRGVSIYEGNDNIIRYNNISDSGTSGIHSWSNSNNNTYTGNDITTSTAFDYYFTSSTTDNYIIDPASGTNIIRLTSSCNVNIENTDNAAFGEDSSNTSYAYLTNFSMYASGLTQTFNITQRDFIITPSIDKLSVWNLEWGSSVAFNASSDTAVNPTWYNITNASWASHNILVYRNGTLFANETTDVSGFMDYNYSDSYSEKWFEFVLGTGTNVDNFTFNNSVITPSAIREGEPFTVSVDINDSDGSIVNAIVKINYHNYTMTQGTGDTWSYTFTGTQIATRYYVTDFYAQDDFGAWNSTVSALYIDAVSSTGKGSSGGISPAPTPTPTPTPEPTVEPEVPVNVTGVLENVTGIVERLSSENSLSIFKLNFDKNPKIFTKEVYLKNTTSCEISEVSSILETCDVENGKITLSVMFLPEQSPFIYTARDHITLYTTDDKSYYINVDVFVLNFVSPVSLTVLSVLILLIICGVGYYWRRKK